MSYEHGAVSCCIYSSKRGKASRERRIILFYFFFSAFVVPGEGKHASTE